MLIRRPANERGHANHGWLDSRFSFSFAEYYDPAHMHFGALRVINDDRIAAGAGFPMHPHRDMEIITYVLDGAIAHQDSMGNGSTIRPGNVQRMSAGTGILHSEFNPQNDADTHLLQIWIMPNVKNVTPSYEEAEFPESEKRGRLRLAASPDGADGSVTIHQDARLYLGLFDGSETVEHAFAAGRKIYVHLARGELTVNGERLAGGDALMLKDEALLQLANGVNAEVLVFDLA
ncbi:pirin family protein [Chitinilyticum piscinae]|uniref:Pirin family protein n=1 Tax=Chitinilyticum piscinae TaxID=2866724 RepID=A0A8J7FXP8_9NEIS|nr:pirin family protein [Chitinilyticum piscinae]MBE9608465.1 pirin family protein [Chitinilyticum piscinae]